MATTYVATAAAPALLLALRRRQMKTGNHANILVIRLYGNNDHSNATTVMPIRAVAPQPAQARDGRA